MHLSKPLFPLSLSLIPPFLFSPSIPIPSSFFLSPLHPSLPPSFPPPPHSQCASVAAHYELREVFDNLIISLCKFTTLLNTHEVTMATSCYKQKHPPYTLIILRHILKHTMSHNWRNSLLNRHEVTMATNNNTHQIKPNSYTYIET